MEIILKTIFLSGGFVDLAYGFARMPLLYPQEVMASVLEWVLSSDSMMRELCKRFFASLKEAKDSKQVH